MEQLIKMITEKTGISESQAKQAIETVTSYLSDKLPGGLGSQLEGFIKGGASTGGASSIGDLGDIADGLKDKLGDMFGK